MTRCSGHGRLRLSRILALQESDSNCQKCQVRRSRPTDKCLRGGLAIVAVESHGPVSSRLAESQRVDGVGQTRESDRAIQPILF